MQVKASKWVQFTKLVNSLNIFVYISSISKISRLKLRVTTDGKFLGLKMTKICHKNLLWKRNQYLSVTLRRLISKYKEIRKKKNYVIERLNVLVTNKNYYQRKLQYHK